MYHGEFSQVTPVGGKVNGLVLVRDQQHLLPKVATHLRAITVTRLAVFKFKYNSEIVEFQTR